MSFQVWIQNCLVPVMINTETKFQNDASAQVKTIADCSGYSLACQSNQSSAKMTSSMHQLQNSPKCISSISYIFLIGLNILLENFNVPRLPKALQALNKL